MSGTPRSNIFKNVIKNPKVLLKTNCFFNRVQNQVFYIYNKNNQPCPGEQERLSHYFLQLSSGHYKTDRGVCQYGHSGAI
jgi:hypothetical protein